MKRKKDLLRTCDVWRDGFVKIDFEENGNCYFEVGSEVTYDIAEAVSIMMRFKNKQSDKVWSIPIPKGAIHHSIDPKKSLYWLSGGDDEWKKLPHYKKEWFESSLEFQHEFGDLIISIVNSSKNLSDIREGFKNLLNLPILYDFAIERGIA